MFLSLLVHSEDSKRKGSWQSFIPTSLSCARIKGTYQVTSRSYSSYKLSLLLRTNQTLFRHVGAHKPVTVLTVRLNLTRLRSNIDPRFSSVARMRSSHNGLCTSSLKHFVRSEVNWSLQNRKWRVTREVVPFAD